MALSSKDNYDEAVATASKLGALGKGLFPTALTPVPFSADVTDINYIVATATFKYTIFNVESLLKDES